MSSRQTPSQTVGPCFAYGLTPEQYGYDFQSIAGPNVDTGKARGEVIRIVGQVFDGAGDPVPDAMLEIWQADPEGRYNHPANARGSNAGFTGFARTGTRADPACRHAITTMKPGGTAPGHAPHINVVLFMRGLLSQAYTRIYFDDEVAANDTDPVLATVPEDRRQTLMARRQEDDDGLSYVFDVHMQGDDETVFSIFEPHPENRSDLRRRPVGRTLFPTSSV